MTSLDEPSSNSSGRGHASLPRATGTSFLGRTHELSDLGELLEGDRLITLMGPPGVGKSRLALELARARAGRFPDGAALVDLVPISDRALLPGGLASALGVPETPGVSLTDSVAGHLRSRRLLLLLDNCEHLLGACAELAELLLGAAPELSILATSREALAVPGESVWRVPPLPAPDGDEETLPEVLLQYPAVRLFVERARAVQPAFTLNAHIAGAVGEISRRLDGLPLALELAATGVEYLTPAEIARRLDDHSRLLATGGRGARSRHQTLQTALDWSHDLLPEAERLLLARLSVFIGDFCLEDVEGVCAGGGVKAANVAALLSRLVSKSLVAADTASGSEVRYRLLETIRAYAGERLEDVGDVSLLRDRHARFYLGLAERAEPELVGPEEARWLKRLDRERANLRAAIDWSLGHGETERALRLAGALVLFWRVRCYFSEGRDCLRAVISASGGAAAGRRAKALWGEGFLTMMAGDPEGATTALEQSLTCFRELGDSQGCARALLILGNQRQSLRDRTGVLALMEESARLAREVGDHWCLAHALGVAGLENQARGELSAARPLLEECLSVARTAGDKQGMSFGLIGLGSVAADQGDYGAAEDVLEEAVVITRELGEDYARAEAVRQLGELALGRGDYARAHELVNEALALALLPEVAPSDSAVSALVVFGRVAHVEGDLVQARAYYEEALARADSPPVLTLPAMGELALSEGDASLARRLFQEACDWGRVNGQKLLLARGLHGLGELPRTNGDAARAAALHREALELRNQIGDVPGIVASLEAIARLAVAVDRPQHGVRLLGAAQALRDRGGYARLPWEASRHQADFALARERLPPEEFEAAHADGGTLSLEEAVALARRGSARRTRPASGWASLTESERQVATLVAESMTNPEIAETLYISLGTVKAHLSHIFAKLGIPGRRELAREVRRREKPGENHHEARR